VPLVLKTPLLTSGSSLWSEGETERITSVSTRITR
jgi:hypothetical protein